MRIIIVGCGKVGSALAEQLSAEGHDLTLIDLSERRLEELTNRLDLTAVAGSGTSYQVLLEAGVQDTDLVIAVTTHDEINLLSCLIARKASDCHAIARVRDPQYVADLGFIRDELGISMAINPELSTARVVSRLIRFPSAIGVSTFARGRIELLDVRIPAESRLEGMAVCEVNPLLRTNVLLCMVRRGDKTYIPKGDFILRTGDDITVIIPPKEQKLFFDQVGVPSTPIKTGHAFKGWYTSASGGSLYNTVTITAAKTFYAQFTANSYTLTWDLGNGTTEETKQTYGEKLTLPTEPTRKNAEFLGWFTEANGGTQVDANTIYKTDGDSTYYAHWEITEVFSVTVPVTLPLIVDEGGEVHVGAAEIINASTGDVIVSSVSISTKNGWQLVPYTTDMAHAKVDAKQLGFKINDSVTTKTGDAETFSLTSPWTIAENGKLPLSYDAVVSAVSQPVTEQDVLSVVFVLEWKGE